MTELVCLPWPHPLRLPPPALNAASFDPVSCGQGVAPDRDGRFGSLAVGAAGLQENTSI